LLAIVERKVKPARLAQNREIRSRYWWRHGETCPALYSAVTANLSVLAVAQTSKYKAFTFLGKDYVYDQKLIVFPGGTCLSFAVMQSTPHLEWAEFQGSSMKDDPVYTPSLCFEPFSFPTALLDTTKVDPVHEATRLSLGSIGERYHQFRAKLMVSNIEGLTSIYNRFHDPSETSNGLLELRRLHGEMDQAVLAAYGWSDVCTACGFGLDYLDTEEEAQLPDDLRQRIDDGNLFFWDANDALDFQGQLQAYGAITGRRKLPWRYRWPDAMRDDVLARLLALNAERYEEEMAMGLHSKGAKKTAGTQRGRKTKSASPINRSSFQLEPEPLQINFDLSGGL
jgi:hypothetical protein